MHYLYFFSDEYEESINDHRFTLTNPSKELERMLLIVVALMGRNCDFVNRVPFTGGSERVLTLHHGEQARVGGEDQDTLSFRLVGSREDVSEQDLDFAEKLCLGNSAYPSYEAWLEALEGDLFVKLKDFFDRNIVPYCYLSARKKPRRPLPPNPDPLTSEEVDIMAGLAAQAVMADLFRMDIVELWVADKFKPVFFVQHDFWLTQENATEYAARIQLCINEVTGDSTSVRFEYSHYTPVGLVFRITLTPPVLENKDVMEWHHECVDRNNILMSRSLGRLTDELKLIYSHSQIAR